jgi:hypothetical protein
MIRLKSSPGFVCNRCASIRRLCTAGSFTHQQVLIRRTFRRGMTGGDYTLAPHPPTMPMSAHTLNNTRAKSGGRVRHGPTTQLPESKECSKCHTIKVHTAFAERAYSKDGLGPWCNLCVSQYQAEVRQKRKALEQHAPGRCA